MSGSLLSGAPTLLNPALGAIGSTQLLAVADAAGLNSESVLGQWSIVPQASSPGFGSALNNLTQGNFSAALSSAQASISAIQSVISFDSVVSFGFVKESEISDYPVEAGGFQTYNKVERPSDIKMTLALGGNFTLSNIVSAVESGSIGGAFSSLTGTTARTKFLNQIEAAQKSVALLNVVTPDKTYQSLNITHVDYDRTAAAGAKLLQVDLRLEQVRTSASASFSNTQSATSAAPENAGPVQSGPLVAKAGSPLANALNNPNATSFTDSQTGIVYNFGPVQ